jgi:hypothetical protein
MSALGGKLTQVGYATSVEGYRVNQGDDAPPKAWWDKNWVWLVAGIPVAIVFILADDYGYGGLFEWAFGFAAGTAVAVAYFWERRSARWFVPAVAFLIVAHIIVLSSRHWHLLPSRSTGTYMALKGVAGMDFAVSGSFLWLVHRLFDPRVGIKAHWSTTAKSGHIHLGVDVPRYDGVHGRPDRSRAL